MIERFRIMGVDGSLTETGLCAPDGTLYTIPTGASNRGDHRLVDLDRQVRFYLRRHPVDVAVMERANMLSMRSQASAIALGMAQGVIRKCLAEFGVPVAFVVPATLKMFATGSGVADKPTMIAAANRHRDHVTRLDVTPSSVLAPITNDNTADAWWLRQMGRWFYGWRDLSETCDDFLHGDQVRDKCTRGPWPKSQGVVWPKLTPGTKRPGHR